MDKILKYVFVQEIVLVVPAICTHHACTQNGMSNKHMFISMVLIAKHSHTHKWSHEFVDTFFLITHT